ncbi:MAG: glycosyltransferase family 2 protein [Bacteroidetes bacterium]|nr:glycosyltransferase family 2 protein [Bacteroidota bacterium]MCL5025126.1 glycosyltransferase family 2 protein [Chloroflexota bacterium]
MAKVSGLVIARNEAGRIGPCLESLSWADEIVVVDADSTDHTVEVCRQYTPRVYQVPFVSFPRQRNAAMDLAAHDWVFFVDADERVEGPLRRELLALAPTLGEGGPAGYAVPRRNIIWGGCVRGGGWHPDYQLRLLDRRRARYDEARAVHEVVLLEGERACLQNDLLHLNYQTFGQFFAKQEHYAMLHAQTLRQAGERTRARSLIGQPMRELGRRYIALGGWRDGWRGLLLSCFLAYYQGRAYWLLRQMSSGQ